MCAGAGAAAPRDGTRAPGYRSPVGVQGYPCERSLHVSQQMVRGADDLAFESPGKAWAPVSGKRRRQPPQAPAQLRHTSKCPLASRSPSPAADAAARDPREDKGRARQMPTAEDFDRLLQPVPKYLRHGPVSPVAPITICCIAIYTVCTWPEVAPLVPSTDADFSQLEAADAAFASNHWLTLWHLHAACCTYGVLVLLQLRSIAGWWPLVTYTVTSWNFQVVRLGLLTLRIPQSVWIAERLRFVCLAGHTTTFVVWWLVLVPIIYKVLPARRRTQFTALNTSPLLINLHVVNLAIAILDFTAAPRRLHLADLYIAVCSP